QKKPVSLGRVCIGCSSCPVKCHIRVLRCFKCNRFGHCKRECRNEMTCTVCAGPHDTKTCTEHGVKCTNCSWVNEKRMQRKQDTIDTGHRAARFVLTATAVRNIFECDISSRTNLTLVNDLCNFDTQCLFANLF